MITMLFFWYSSIDIMNFSNKGASALKTLIVLAPIRPSEKFCMIGEEEIPLSLVSSLSRFMLYLWNPIPMAMYKITKGNMYRPPV